MSRGIYCTIVALICLTPSLTAARTWTDSSGKYKIEAEFVRFAEGKVLLLRDDGKQVSVPFARLSSADKKFVLAKINGGKAATASGSATTSVAAVNDWPQWRGPNRDGVSQEKGLLDRWPEGGPKIAWQTRGLGRGYASVSVAGGKIFTMGKRNDAEYLIALDVANGKELWTARVGNGKHSNCTPTVDGDLVFAVGLNGDLLCADANSGKEVWRKNYGRDFGGKMMSGWGFSESPLVDGDRLICTPGGANAIIAALDKRTGRPLWTTAMPYGGRRGNDGAGYSSVVISNAAGVKQYVQLVGRSVIGVDAKNGRLLWNYDRIVNGTANVPTPIVKGDYVFCSSGYGDGGSALLKLNRQGNRIAVEEKYYFASRQVQNHHGGMILLGDYIYMGHGHNNGFPLCIHMMTGKEAWRPGRGPGSGSAAIIYADGHFYFRYENATMALIEATPDEYRLKGTFRIASNNDRSWPHPVIAGGKLYLRDQDELHCYDISK